MSLAVEVLREAHVRLPILIGCQKTCVQGTCSRGLKAKGTYAMNFMLSGTPTIE